MSGQSGSVAEEPDLTELAKLLKNSPVFQMSLSNKELFHSNLWAWLLEQDEGFRNWFFDERLPKQVTVHREKDHMDIQLEDENHNVWVIENKLKSLPRQEQLCGYTSKLGARFVKGVITGIVKPDFDLPNNWQFKSYGEIADAIEKAADRLRSTEPYVRGMLQDYSKCVRNLSLMLNKAANCEVYPIAVDKVYEDIRIDDIYKKIAMNRFARQVRASIAENELLKDKVKVNEDFSNKTAILTIVGPKLDQGELRVQIQGRQYRVLAGGVGPQI